MYDMKLVVVSAFQLFDSMVALVCRFHPICMNFTQEQVKKMEQFVCPDCSSQAGDKKLRQSSPNPPPDRPAKVCQSMLMIHFHQPSEVPVTMPLFCSL